MRWPVTNLDQVRAVASAAKARCPGCRCRVRATDGEECPVCGAALRASTLRIRRDRTGPRDGSAAWPLAANAALSVLVIGLSVAQGGRMPILAWLAPFVLGAAVFGLRYWAVFVMRWPDEIAVDRGCLWAIAALQVAGAAALVI